MTRSTLVIGLDGADWSLLNPLIEDGAMPTLKAFVESGVSATLESIRPTNSMSAWTSLMTGANPGKHGVYDFVRKTETPFRTTVTNSSVIGFPTIWETLTAAGRSSCVIDMPPLYPPFEINGAMIGGMGAVTSFDRSYTWPAELAAEVENAVGEFMPDVAWVGKAGQQEELLEEWSALVDNRRKVAEYLLGKQAWDLFFAVFVAPDRVQHVFWQELTERGPLYSKVRRFYEKMDEAIASLIERVDTTESDVLLVSDHGFRTFHNTFDVNQVFAEAGLRKWHDMEPFAARVLRKAGRIVKPLAGRLDQIIQRRYPAKRELLDGSVAYSDISESVHLNLAGRESTGSVSPGEVESVRELVTSNLMEFRDPQSGQPVIKEVLDGGNYFHGAHDGNAPDLLLECHDGYAHNNGLGRVMFRWTYCQGVHSMNGIIAGLGPSFRREAKAPTISILDVTPTLLALQGLGAPEGTDGRIAEELLERTPQPAEQPAAPSERSGEATPYTEEEEEAVRERLRGLGYIE